MIDRLLIFVVQCNEELWVETAQRLTDEVQQIIEFAKFVPGFIGLMQDDQIMLLKGGTCPSLVFTTCRRHTAQNAAIGRDGFSLE